MLAEPYVPAFRTLIFVPRLRVPEGVVAVADFFFLGFYFCWFTQPAEHLTSDVFRLFINLTYSILVAFVSYQESYCTRIGRGIFFMFMKDAGHMLKLNVAGRRRKSPPPPPLIRSHGRKLFMLDIATVNPLLFYETGSKSTEGYYTGANCCGFLTRGSLFKYNPSFNCMEHELPPRFSIILLK